jgi:2-desacetyl-2-hydroxyethyl bacteriochlorophyllide A dehydrogenase
MRYVCIPAPGRIELREREAPTPAAGELLLRLRYGGICGSDVGTFKGSFLYAKYPRIPGHELSAEVVSAGPGVAGPPAGTLVTVNPYFNCGRCYSCRRGHVNCCTDNQTLGAQRDGGFQELLAVPAERVYDGRGLSPRALALVEPYCIGHHAVKRARVVRGERVLVIGAGTIGLYAAIDARLAGAQVHVADVVPRKLELAERLGMAGTLLAGGDDADFAARVAAATGGDGFDVCLEAVGLPSTFQRCIEAAAHRARVVVIGIGKQSLDFRYTVIQTKELDVLGSRNALREDFLEVIELARSGRVDLPAVVSEEYGLPEAARAFQALAVSAGERLKVMVRFQGE